MTAALRDPYAASDARWATLLDDDGNPPHGTDCATCALFLAHQQPLETRAAWMARLADATRQALWPGLDSGEAL
jgi:hypothetical protein